MDNTTPQVPCLHSYGEVMLSHDTTHWWTDCEMVEWTDNAILVRLANSETVVTIPRTHEGCARLYFADDCWVETL